MNVYIEKGSSTGTGELGTAPMEKVLHLICFVKYPADKSNLVVCPEV